MNEIRFYCQHCGQPLEAPTALQGVSTTCTRCGQQTNVPERPQPITTEIVHGPPQPVQPYVPQPKDPGSLATAALWLGIFSFCFGCFTGLPALICGVLALNKGEDRIYSIVGIVLGCLALIGSGVATLFLWPFLLAL